MGKNRALARLVVITLLAVALMATGAQAQAPVPAQSSRAFGDSVGVNIRLSHVTSGYGDFETVFARLREAGIRYVYDSLCATCTPQIDRMRRLAEAGIRATVSIDTPWSAGTAAIGPTLQTIKNRLRGAVVAVAGVNEPDLTGDPLWIPKTRAYTTELYQRVKADPALADLPVIGPSLVFRGSRAALGDLSSVVDRGNLHPYPGGRPPLLILPDERQMMSAVSGSKPLVATEIGYHSDLGELGGHRGAPEDIIAAYTPRIPLEAFRFGIERTHFFQLADQFSDAEAAQINYPKWQNRFGLLRDDLSPKPAFIALRNLMRAVDSDSAPVSAPGSLRYALDGAGPDVRQLLLRSSDGSFRLALWRDASLWNQDTLQRVSPALDHVDVALGERISQALRFDPRLAATPTQAWDEPSRIGVDLGGEAVVLDLIPPGTAADRAGSRSALRAGRLALRAGRRLGSCRPKEGRTKKQQKRARRAATKRASGRGTTSWSARCVRVRRR
jgi:hypothetical protein